MNYFEADPLKHVLYLGLREFCPLIFGQGISQDGL